MKIFGHREPSHLAYALAGLILSVKSFSVFLIGQETYKKLRASFIKKPPVLLHLHNQTWAIKLVSLKINSIVSLKYHGKLKVEVL